MEILKGIVSDAGYQNVECTYAKIDDNTFYYFIQNGELPNGNVIASTVLKEAIGHAPYTTLGLINKEGQVLIPFENKVIRQIKDQLLLVEKNIPSTPSVAEALKNKADPFSASSLVETATNIKKQVTDVIGMNGDFIFDNQFSEAAIYTMDGLNVANGYFSFIAENNGNYFFSANVLGSQIIKFNPEQLEEMNTQNDQSQQTNVGDDVPEENQEQQAETSEQNPTIPGIAIDIPIQNQLEQAGEIEENNNSTEEIAENTEQVETEENEQDNNSDIKLNIEEPEETTDGGATNQEENKLTDEAETEEENKPTDEAETEEENEQTDEAETEEGNEPTDEAETEEENKPTDEVETEEENEQTDEAEEEEENEQTDEAEEEEENKQTDEAEEEVENEQTDEAEEEVENEQTNEAETEEENESTDEVEAANSQPINNNITTEDIQNPVIADATNTIRKLLNENREQRQTIDKQMGELEALKSNYSILQEETDSKEQEIISLRQEMNNYRSQSINYERENTKLKSTLMRQSDVMKNLETQNSDLREQVAGLHALGSAVAEANVLIEPVEEEQNNNQNQNTDGITYGSLNDFYEPTGEYQKTKVA